MLCLLGIVAFLGVNLLLYSAYTKKQGKLSKEIQGLEQEITVRHHLLSQAFEWEKALLWFEKHSPKAERVEDAQNSLLNKMLTLARTSKLELNPSKPVNYLPAVLTGTYPQVRVSISFTSTEASFFDWVTQTSSPNDFRALTRLKVEPHLTDKSKIVVEAVVSQWIAPEGSEEATPAEEESMPATEPLTTSSVRLDRGQSLNPSTSYLEECLFIVKG